MPAPVNAAVRAQVVLERLKAGHVRDWQSVQVELRTSYRQIMAALEVQTLQELNRRELNALLAELQAAHVRITAAGMAKFSEELAPLAEFAALLEVKELGKLAAGLKFNAPTAKAAYNYALQTPINATGQLLKPFVENWSKADAARTANLVRTGWAQNRPLMDMVREATGTRKNGYQDGFLDVSRRHAGTVINTATQHTASAARMATFEANGDIITGYEWVATLDRRTTQVCRSLDGRKFEAGKGPLPPIHPNCRSTTAATLGPEWDFLDEDATRASAGPKPGPVEADETFYSWLQKQPAEFQDFAIGKSRGKLLRNGGLTSERFAALNIDRNFQPLTLAEMRQIEPRAFAKAGL